MKQIDIEFPYDEIMNKEKQKEYYQVLGRKRRVAGVVCWMIANVVIFEYFCFIPGAKINSFLFFEYILGTVILLPRIILWTKFGFFKAKRGILCSFIKERPIILSITNKSVQMLNGGCVYSLCMAKGKGHILSIAFVRETRDMIYFGRNAYMYLFYIDKKVLSQEECEFVTSTLRRLYGKRYKQVM